jgi:hypothetical protein
MLRKHDLNRPQRQLASLLALSLLLLTPYVVRNLATRFNNARGHEGIALASCKVLILLTSRNANTLPST